MCTHMVHFNRCWISKSIFILGFYFENILFTKNNCPFKIINTVNTELRALVRPSSFIVFVIYSSTSMSSSFFSLHSNLSFSKVNLSFSRKSP